VNARSDDEALVAAARVPDDMTSTLPQRVLALARAHPSATAQIAKRRGRWVSVGWLECAVQIERAAAALAAGGLSPGDKVVVVGDCEPELVWTVLAILALGAVVVPLDPAAPPSQVADAVRACGAAHAAAGDLEQLDKLRGLPLERVFGWRPRQPADGDGPAPTFLAYQPLGSVSERAPDGADMPSLDAGALDAPAFVSIDNHAQTLRTTTQRELIDVARALLPDLAIDSGDRYLCSIPLAYEVARVVGLALPLLRPLITCFQESPDQVESALVELQPELVMMDAPYWQRVASDLARRVRRGVAASSAGGHVAPRRGWREALLQRPLRRHLGLANAKAVLSVGPGGRCSALESCGVALVGVDALGALVPSNGGPVPPQPTC
jgi:long-chain acyl-CoA synthetase